jgi:hypothetical protein
MLLDAARRNSCSPICVGKREVLEPLRKRAQAAGIRLGDGVGSDDGTLRAYDQIFDNGGPCDGVKLKKWRDIDAFDKVAKRSMEAKTGRNSFKGIQTQLCADIVIRSTQGYIPEWHFARGRTGNLEDNPKIAALFEDLKVEVVFDL